MNSGKYQSDCIQARQYRQKGENSSLKQKWNFEAAWIFRAAFCLLQIRASKQVEINYRINERFDDKLFSI